MAVTYTNRKGQTYTLYRGQTKTGKPRYYFGRMGKSQDEPVTELPPGFTISESVNGIVSLVKDRPTLIMPEEVAAVEEAVKLHPAARRYRIAVLRRLPYLNLLASMRRSAWIPSSTRCAGARLPARM